MAKDPAVLFYSSDFLSGIQDLTMEERGQYITLLCLQHQKGHLSDKAIKLSVGNAAADVMAKFRQDPAGLWYNERMEDEIGKRQVHSKKQSERASEGWKKRKKDAVADAVALPLENVNANEIINTSKELCKIFGKEFQPSENRMSAEVNWYNTIEGQATEILTVLKPDEAIKQIKGYIRYCRAKERQLIGKNYKAAETILSSNWLELLGENKTRAPNEFIAAEVDLQNYTPEAWMDTYGWHMKNNEAFKKHFDGKLSLSQPVGSNDKR